MTNKKQAPQRRPRERSAAAFVEVVRVRKTLATLIAWLPQSANAPIRVDEAQRLLNMLEGK